MASTTFLEGSEIDIDKILAESEARIASQGTSIVPAAKLAVTAPTAATSGQHPVGEKTKEEEKKPSLRIAQLERVKQKVRRLFYWICVSFPPVL